MNDAADRLPRVAYFSMEIALDPAVPTYSGGLGVLAGDMLQSAADLAVALIGVTLVSRQGYFRQEIAGGMQVERPEPWEPARFAEPVAAKVPLDMGGRRVWVGAWRYLVTSRSDGAPPVPVLLLDTDLPENAPEDRRLTDFLYGGDERYRLRQEMVLGIAGVRMLAALGVQVTRYHLNEGHAALLALELLRMRCAAAQSPAAPEALAAVRRQCVFTTHTPVPAGHDQFAYPLALAELGSMVQEPLLRTLAGDERLNMTRLALSLSGWVNGVAQRHAETASGMFPGYTVHAIGNGVHPWTWASDAHRLLYARHVPHWCHEPERLMMANRIALPEIAAAHAAAKRLLLERAAEFPGGAALRPERCTLGFARRMTAYKRPELLFADLERLRRIAGRYPLQVLLAGKAHPHDLEGKREIERLLGFAQQLGAELPVVFLPGYGLELARLMVAGVDVWLNTPQRPLEASGTSGMKAALNGVPSLSVLDGWWIEGCAEGVTGWAVGGQGPEDSGADALSLYSKLEEQVLPLFYQRPAQWTELTRSTIAHNGSFFNSHRMVRRYVLEAYAR
ncbi:alpha-glucan family phosphorylase [Caenimonas terrae]|uniref:glycogen phosphorylase n=1 Tax=Caenimonas terrae TaxID=696074 RepID=A0ABW0NG39_9BURK